MSSGAPANPYVGLRPFRREDSQYFFGRRAQIGELLRQLDSGFLSVVGGSGCGKSSLIKAGLIPALEGGFLESAGHEWLIAEMRPGESPIRNLVASLLRSFEPDVGKGPIDELDAAVRERHLDPLLDLLRPKLVGDTTLLLLVDQFEELFAFRGTLAEEAVLKLTPEQRGQLRDRRSEASDFVDLVLALAERTKLPIYTVLTMRTDFLGDCDVFYGLPEAMNRSRYLVPRLTRKELKEAIRGPALMKGATVEPRLVDMLLSDLGDRADRLPVLQHALLRTWDEWQSAGSTGAIDIHPHYEDAGTLKDALDKDASRAMSGLDKRVVKRVFKTLTAVDHNQRRVRRSARISELVAVCGGERTEVDRVIKRFGDSPRNFLYVADEGQDGDALVSISHESLIRRWQDLAKWVDQEHRDRDLLERLIDRSSGAALEGNDLRRWVRWRDTAIPQRGGEAAQAWAARYLKKPEDFDRALDYLNRSEAKARRDAERQAQQEKRQRRKKVAAWGGIPAALAVALIGYLATNQVVAPDQFVLAIVSGTSDSVQVGFPRTLNATALERGTGASITGTVLEAIASGVYWRSDDSTVATVSGDGSLSAVVTGIGPGDAEVSVVSGSSADAVTIRVSVSDDLRAEAGRRFEQALALSNDPRMAFDSIYVTWQRLNGLPLRYGLDDGQAAYVAESVESLALLAATLTAADSIEHDEDATLFAKQVAWGELLAGAKELVNTSLADMAAARLDEVEDQLATIPSLLAGALGVCPGRRLCEVAYAAGGVLKVAEPFQSDAVSVTARLTVPRGSREVAVFHYVWSVNGVEEADETVSLDPSQSGERRFVSFGNLEPGSHEVRIFPRVDGRRGPLIARIEACIERCMEEAAEP